MVLGSSAVLVSLGDLLSLEELVQLFVSSEKVNNFTVKFDVACGKETTRGANEREHNQFDRIEGILGAEVGLEKGADGFWS